MRKSPPWNAFQTSPLCKAQVNHSSRERAVWGHSTRVLPQLHSGCASTQGTKHGVFSSLKIQPSFSNPQLPALHHHYSLSQPRVISRLFHKHLDDHYKHQVCSWHCFHSEADANSWFLQMTSVRFKEVANLCMATEQARGRIRLPGHVLLSHFYTKGEEIQTCEKIKKKIQK